MVHQFEQVSLCKQVFKDAPKYMHTVGVMLLTVRLTNVAISLFLPIWHLFILLQPNILKIYIKEDKKYIVAQLNFYRVQMCHQPFHDCVKQPFPKLTWVIINWDTF